MSLTKWVQQIRSIIKNEEGGKMCKHVFINPKKVSAKSLWLLHSSPTMGNWKWEEVGERGIESNYVLARENFYIWYLQKKFHFIILKSLSKSETS